MEMFTRKVYISQMETFGLNSSKKTSLITPKNIFSESLLTANTLSYNN